MRSTASPKAASCVHASSWGKLVVVGTYARETRDASGHYEVLNGADVETYDVRMHTEECRRDRH